jgi:tmRNA-binding protein
MLSELVSGRSHKRATEKERDWQREKARIVRSANK